MAKRALQRFDDELEKLFIRRTHWVRGQVRKPKQGKPPTFARGHVDKAVNNLNKLTEACLLRDHAVQRLADIYDEKRQWHVVRSKGWGVENKRKSFIEWYERNKIGRNCVYVFWAGKKCRYVGRTMKGQNRPQTHFTKHWFIGVTRVDLYHSRVGRNVPKLECLATHRFRPRFSKIKPSSKRWYARCPICETQKTIAADVRSLFRLH
jgi:hypothetical protein